MKSCEEYKELLDLYIDRELGRMERMEVEAHLEECPDCQKEYETLLKIFNTENYEMPESVCDKVMERVRESSNDDFFTGVEKTEEQRIAALKRANRKAGFKAWGIIAACAVLGVTNIVFGRVMKNRNAASTDTAEVTVEETAEEAQDYDYSADYSETVERNGLSEEDAALNALYDTLYGADRMEVKLGSAKVAYYERFYIEYLSDYLKSNECVKVSGKLTSKSIGYIKTEPEDGMNILITDAHTVIFTDQGTLYEVQTDSAELLNALEGLGLH